MLLLPPGILEMLGYLGEKKRENEPTVLEYVLPCLDCLTFMRQTLSPNVHHVAKIIWVPPVVLQEHVAYALLTLKYLLEEDEVFILHGVNVAGQILSNLLHSQMLSVLIVLVELLPELLVDALLSNLLAQHVAVVHVISNAL